MGVKECTKITYGRADIYKAKVRESEGPVFHSQRICNSTPQTSLVETHNPGTHIEECLLSPGVPEKGEPAIRPPGLRKVISMWPFLMGRGKKADAHILMRTPLRRNPQLPPLRPNSLATSNNWL